MKVSGVTKVIFWSALPDLGSHWSGVLFSFSGTMGLQEVQGLVMSRCCLEHPS